MPNLMKFPLRIVVGIIVLLLALVACQGPPPTQYLLEVTREVTVVVVATPTPEGNIEAESVPDANNAVTSTPQPNPTQTPVVLSTEVTSDTALPNPIVNAVTVAEQRFENGRMFYLRPTDEIWVLEFGDDSSSGTWTIHPDAFEEGMPEFDPNIEAPEGLFQPERGFGKLWRENADVGDGLGWALGAEQGHVTTYSYIYGGEINDNNVYVQGPGYHTLDSIHGGTFIFDESDSTWRFEPEESTNGN